MLTNLGIHSVYHYVPLHYLVFIFRSSSLLSKVALQSSGFATTHLRTTSKKQDIERGFGEYIHLSLEECPRILRAKLRAGFPHFEIMIPASEVEVLNYHLCRFNIAKARYFRGAKQEPTESPKNGYYYGKMALPIAVSDKERHDLLKHNIGKNMIEVLVPDQLVLPKNTAFGFYCQEDLEVATEIADELSVSFDMRQIGKGITYNSNIIYTQAVNAFLEKSLENPDWFGDGLEFDRV